MSKKEEKRFILKKFIMAISVVDALKKEKSHDVDEVFIDGEWKKPEERSPAGY